jgi:hypothetical protein
MHEESRRRTVVRFAATAAFVLAAVALAALMR